jgi:hypothetical protein
MADTLGEDAASRNIARPMLALVVDLDADSDRDFTVSVFAAQ